ncbi:MAG: bacteriocin family protein [Anaerolineae bacterium]|nr:bacteriocin family protein [Anaerolineae bacterium]
MANKYLARDDAPFGAELWEKLDAAMIQTAKRQLTGRRLLEIEGPFGLGLKSIPLPDVQSEDGLITSGALPVVWIQKQFSLGMRDLANFESIGIALDTAPVVQAATECAHLEDKVVFHGAAGVPGLLTVEGRQELALSDWTEVGAAAQDVITAVTQLDAAGFHGPYVLALAPERFNLLYRLYPRGNQTEMAHVQQIVTGGIVKAQAVKSGGVLIASGKQFASIVLGQDMTIGFIGPAEGSVLEFTISESLTIRIRQPQAICVLR